jgi:hypothetical protein
LDAINHANPPSDIPIEKSTPKLASTVAWSWRHVGKTQKNHAKEETEGEADDEDRYRGRKGVPEEHPLHPVSLSECALIFSHSALQPR